MGGEPGRAVKYRNRIGRDVLPSGKAVYRAKTVVRGQPRKFTHKNRVLVEQWLEERDRERAGLPASGRTRRFLLRQAFDGYLAELRKYRRPATTVQYYENKFTQLREGLGEDGFVDWLGQTEIDAYITQRLEQVGIGTVLKELRALATVCSWLKLRREWEIPRMLAESHKPRRKRIPTVEAAARLWLRLEPPARAAMGLCLLAGWRAQEALRARADWCDWRARELYLPEEGTKEREPNRTAMVATLAAVLPRKGCLVAATKGQVTAAFKRASKAAGVEPAIHGPGIFRHCAGTWLAELGYGRDDRALILSHARGDVTERYTHSQLVGRKRAMLRKLEAYFLRAVAAARGRKPGTKRVHPPSATVRKRPRRLRVVGGEAVN
jgi:integrase